MTEYNSELHRQGNSGSIGAQESRDGSHFNKTKLYKRPLLHFDKDYNDIYITNKVPLCVYYKRAIQLLRWRLSDLFSLAEKEFISRNNINPKTGYISNKNSITLEYTKQDLHTNSALYTSKARVVPNRKGDSAISIYAAGSCITRALYLLQDIFDYVKHIYLDGEAKLNKGTVCITCENCRSQTKRNRSKHSEMSTRHSTCVRCKKLLNYHLENIVKRIIDVSIDTGSLLCVDDVWKFELLEENLDTNPKHSLFSHSDTKVVNFEKHRIISSIRIAINIPNCSDQQ